jgi:hypothetical protein
MDNPTYMQLKARDLAIISIFSAVCIAAGYAKGLALSSLPGVVEFMTVLIFISGFMFGWIVGVINGALTLIIYMLVPYPFAHPAAFLFTISPILLVIMALLGAFYGIAGGILGKHYNPISINARFIAAMAFWGFALTFIYDVLGSVGFYLAYPVFYTSVWEAIYLTFIPLYMPYPPIIHTFMNTIVFALLVPPLTKAISSFPGIKATKPSSQ